MNLNEITVPMESNILQPSVNALEQRGLCKRFTTCNIIYIIVTLITGSFSVYFFVDYSSRANEEDRAIAYLCASIFLFLGAIGICLIRMFCCR